MKKVLLAFPVVGFLAFSLAGGIAKATGGFSQTCTSTKVDSNGRLTSVCKKADGKTGNRTSISLNQHIGNIDGVLKWGDKAFAKTCKSISFSGPATLQATCKNKQGKYAAPSSLNLDEHIANINGVLKYE